ncbi:DUF1003 domain-containing protein [Methylobacterium nodulans]|uniref:DUF1003 domain-containing protein n=1 Tax=Methylobacterium nodulans (strain LMG 21967 / CNCM I-2342 / ORS 2060) TaxID=460265 RepID=B8I9X1_METNO|nr:DUF1003 domain-containing protein [Methylobacterium nodulans]ACL57199.1 protein of unknown function DUF1003 [Methylobacterium nodulans ORS 2060]
MTNRAPKSVSLPESPTAHLAPESGFSSVLGRNIHMLQERRRAEEGHASFQDRLAGAITRFTGSMAFVYVHLAIVALWIAVNVGWIPQLPRFDETFVILATASSVEAIFLSTFVLISQNRAAAAADSRADLDLQINLLSEHEVTRLLTLTIAIAERLGIEEAKDPQLDELQEHVAPEKVLDELEDREAS